MNFILNACLFAILLAGIPNMGLADEASDLLAKRSELQRQKDEAIRIDRNAEQVARDWKWITEGFERESANLRNNLEKIDRFSVTRNAQLDEVNKWLTRNYQYSLKLKDSAQFRAIKEEYRKLRATNNVCSSTDLSDSLNSAAKSLVAMHQLKEQAVELGKNWNLPSDFDNVRNSIKTNSDILNQNLQDGAKSLAGYLDFNRSSEICAVFFNFESMIAMAEAINEANKAADAIDAIDINTFLIDLSDLSKERDSIKDSRRIITSISGKQLANIRLGKLNETLASASSFASQIEFLSDQITALKFVSAGDKAEFSQFIADSRDSFLKANSDSGVFTLEGKRSFLLTRSRNVQTRLFKLKSATLDADKSVKYKNVLQYCQSELNLSPSGRLILPSSLTFDQTLDLDSKFARAQEMLREIDGVEI